MPEIPLGTVVGPQGPKGDKGDKGDTGTFSPEDLRRITDLESGKVDKVTGKGLSTNDYTDADKNAVATIGNKVDKVTGKGLSTNDYTTAEKNKLSGIAAEANKTIIDDTLSNTGQAADAKTTGNSIAALRDFISRMEIYCEASGNPATFQDAKAANIKALSVTITPTQSGSGDPSPSNVRPISGVSSVSVTRTGKNLCPDIPTQTMEGVTWTTTNGVSVTSRTSAGTQHSQPQLFSKVPIGQTPFTVGETYRLTGCPAGGADGASGWFLRVVGWKSDGVSIANMYSDTGNGVSFTVPPTWAFVSVFAHYGMNVTNTLTWYPCIYPATFPDTFEPYQGQTVTVPLIDSNDDPLTVYGGTLDVTTGELTVNVGMVEAQTLTAKKLSNSVGYENYFTLDSEGVQLPSSRTAPAFCSHYAFTSETNWARLTNFHFMIRPDTERPAGVSLRIGVRDSHYTTVEDFTAYLNAQKSANTPVIIVYPLATPATYQLTPQELATLSGYNAVFSDAGTVDVTYKADASIILGGG